MSTRSSPVSLSPPPSPTPAPSSVPETFIGNITLSDGTVRGVYVIIKDQNGQPMNCPTDPQTLETCTRLFQEIVANAQHVQSVTDQGLHFSNTSIRPHTEPSMQNWTTFKQTLLGYSNPGDNLQGIAPIAATLYAPIPIRHMPMSPPTTPTPSRTSSPISPGSRSAFSSPVEQPPLPKTRAQTLKDRRQALQHVNQPHTRGTPLPGMRAVTLPGIDVV